MTAICISTYRARLGRGSSDIRRFVGSASSIVNQFIRIFKSLTFLVRYSQAVPPRPDHPSPLAAAQYRRCSIHYLRLASIRTASMPDCQHHRLRTHHYPVRTRNEITIQNVMRTSSDDRRDTQLRRSRCAGLRDAPQRLEHDRDVAYQW